MSKDINPILEGWDYKPEQISVRRMMGMDGKEKIQMRLDLGLMQMEISGRPDGKRPHGKESLLDHYLSLIEEQKAKYGTTENFKLDNDDCAKLRMESMQYYYRRISFFELEEYEGAKEDAEHNLQIMDLVKEYAADERDKIASEQYRAYVIMHRTRARGLISLAKKNYDKALEEIEEGIEEIEDFFRSYNRGNLIEASYEITHLRDWAEEIRENRPLGLKEKLEKDLQMAVESEEYEKAAKLRDRIRKLEEPEGRRT